MASFARQGNRVLFVENTGVRTPRLRDFSRIKKRLFNWLTSARGFRKVQDRLWVYSPVILPFPYSRMFRGVNRWLLLRAIKRWMWAMEFHDPILWTFLPTGIALDVITHLDHKLAVYYCIADFETLVNRPHKVRHTEQEILKRCDLVFAQGKTLQEKCQRWNAHVHIFPFGVNLEAFEHNPLAPLEAPEDLRDISRPIVGYVGGLHRHVDFELLQMIAQRHPDWSLVLVGPVQTDVLEIRRARNAFLLGEKPFSRLPQYINMFDVCIIPYVNSEYTKTVYPTKLNEYHALGKPVVSTLLPEVVEFNAQHGPLIHLAETHDQFMEQLERALAQDNTVFKDQRIAAAQENAWSHRIAQMSQLIEEHLRRKTDVTPVNWPDRFLTVYRQVRHRAVTAFLAMATIYLVMFHSPMIWWVATPLRVVDTPRPADVIVVFAGGVGESGQAGQGYAERVERAVALYRQRLAQHLVFSSGYVYALNETELMRALAVSLEVPPSAIRLESQAKNTVENVRFTSEIARQQGWRSFLLVSSPYHMRRSLLVFRRQAPDLDVIAAPVSETLFFNRSGRIRLRQWRAILHEYLGIVYYWWKGYL